MRKSILAIALLLLFPVVGALSMSGCTSAQVDNTLNSAQQIHDATTQAIDQLQQTTVALKDTVSTAQAQATTLPISDPNKAKLEAVATSAENALDQANTKLVAAQQVLAQSQAVITAAQNAKVTGDTSDLEKALSSLPYVGPYVGLIMLGYGLFKSVSTNQTLKNSFGNLVTSVESAFPKKTDAQKAALATVQDTTTKQLVAQVKAALPPTSPTSVATQA